MKAALSVVCMLLISGCTGLFLHPDKSRTLDPGVFGLEFTEETLRDGHGPDLVYWDLPARGAYRGTILFLHGNAGNISTHIQSVAWLPTEGYRVILFDYRGYGGSRGEPDIEGIHVDAQRMIALVAKLEPSRSKRILFGQSLGASVALYAAAEFRKDGEFGSVVADSPFASYRAIAREKMAQYWLTYLLQQPLGWTVSDRYSAIKVVGTIDVPILYIHGAADETVPAHHSEELCEANKPFCTRWVLPQAGHIYALNTLGIRRQLLEWLSMS